MGSGTRIPEGPVAPLSIQEAGIKTTHVKYGDEASGPSRSPFGGPKCMGTQELLSLFRAPSSGPKVVSIYLITILINQL